MHRLGREVRFSVNPFADETSVGHNSYASKPAGEGLAIYLALCAELEGDIDPATGFFINVVDIDRIVRMHAAGVFVEGISAAYRSRRDVTLPNLAAMLRSSWHRLDDKFGAARLARLRLALNPNRHIAVDSESSTMFEFSERFSFAAMHRLWNDSFTPEQNFGVFGKCANPAGHGHNYVLEVTVATDSAGAFRIGDFERTVDEHFISIVDHKNLNVDIPQFRDMIPTVENIASVAWNSLNGRFLPGRLVRVTVWETDRTFASYDGTPQSSSRRT
jgi:6-pyruvoyltetrahydropterin/6-carboxytetrahydropterin synthase